MKANRRVGIFGGTFDPIHVGHLRAAEEVRERLRLRNVIFVPNRVPPHKPGRRPAAADARLAMARLAVRGDRGFAVSDVEVARAGPSYTVATLDYFRALRGREAELFFILGADAFAEVATWRRAADLFAKAHFVVMTRPGARLPGLRAVLPPEVAARFRRSKGAGGEDAWTHETGHVVRSASVTPLDISSSDIRARVARGESIRYLTPVAVARYIARHGLYR